MRWLSYDVVVEVMSLDKSIVHGKEKRRPYHGAKADDKSCRNHGGCKWCLANRMHKYKKMEEMRKWTQQI